PLHRSELDQETLLERRPYAGDLVEDGGMAEALTLFPVIGDGEAVGFVPNPSDQTIDVAALDKLDRMLAIGQDQTFLGGFDRAPIVSSPFLQTALGDPDDGQTKVGIRIDHLHHRADLRTSAV